MKTNTFYHGDCLTVLSHDIESQSIDLIYLDPPFFTGKVQKGTLKSNAWAPEAMEVSYEDSKVFWKEQGYATHSPPWLLRLGDSRPDFASYLYYMQLRLRQCCRVLKQTGSIYLHCDEKASHYLKMIMDELFGWENFRGEIIWNYNRWTNATRDFAKMHDTIFWFSKSPRYFFDKKATVVQPTEYQKSAQRRGYSTNNINGKRQIIIFDEAKAPSDLSNFEIVTHKAPENCVTYANDVWSDIFYLGSGAKERLGYPTQKPIKLLERIVAASSQERDIILDPFCGCGTAIIAAQLARRKWIGIDVNRQAINATQGRCNQLPDNLGSGLIENPTIIRDLETVKQLKPLEFEAWVNEYYQATKPRPDRGVDGITPDGIPIQVKSNLVKYSVLTQAATDIKLHPVVPKPVKRAIIVSQVGFDDSARQAQSGIKREQGVELELVTLEQLLCADMAHRVGDAIK